LPFNQCCIQIFPRPEKSVSPKNNLAWGRIGSRASGCFRSKQKAA
jgi:hypothetical protein